ncbi:MAG TPA: hypothetical protein VMI06_15970 [Terriglobia bacterium]|nr:hypothetical protein [Terriglobia bacterium]
MPRQALQLVPDARQTRPHKASPAMIDANHRNLDQSSIVPKKVVTFRSRVLEVGPAGQPF